MPVGGFPGLVDQNRRTIRAPDNPMDRCTIVSIYNKEITEVKPTISPGKFHIMPGSYEKPAVLVVGSSSWWKEIDEQQPLIEIPNGSPQIAASFINDYCNGLLAVTMGTAMPGLFWVPGNLGPLAIQKDHKHLLDRAKVMQNRWYQALVNLAKGLWASTNGNPLVISDDMRTAAKELNLTDADWMKDFSLMQTVRCPACGSPRNSEYPVCPTCHAIVDPEKAKALNIQFAQK